MWINTALVQIWIFGGASAVRRRQVARCVDECWRRQSEAAAFWGRVVPEVPGGESRYARVRKVIRV